MIMCPRGELNNFLYQEAPPRGPTPYPFIYVTIFHEKIPFSYT